MSQPKGARRYFLEPNFSDQTHGLTMFKACYLHIGMEKTGSTTIQSTMVANRKRLLNSGYFYSWAMGRENHVNLVVYARDDDTSDNQRKHALARTGQDMAAFRTALEARFATEAQKHAGKVLLLSNEHLQSRLTNLGEKQRLHGLLSARSETPVQIYLYLRRQDLAATSLYGTRLLSGTPLDFGEVLPQLDPQEPLPYFYDYLRMWREWCQVFGRMNVHVRVFEPDALLTNDVVSDFLDWLGLDGRADFIRPAWQNESISEAAQYYLTRMNRLNPTFNGSVPNPLRGQVNQRVIRTCKGRGLKPDRASAETFYARFREDNAHLFKEARLEQDNFTETFDQFEITPDAPTVAPQNLANVAVAVYQDAVAELNATRAELKAAQAEIDALKTRLG
ncbi:MAG: hypothetical protein ACPGVS_01925 [Primorskyibacter sp.]